MPITNFKKAFKQYSIAMYQDWKVERNTVSEVGQMIKRYITNGFVE